MPGGDKTGPAGWGPMTGRGAGFCAGYGMPGYMNPIPGRGFGIAAGRGRGRGRGFRHGWGPMAFGAGFPGWGGRFGFNANPGQAYAPNMSYSGPDELQELQEQAKYLNDTLKDINKRIEAITRQREE